MPLTSASSLVAATKCLIIEKAVLCGEDSVEEDPPSP